MTSQRHVEVFNPVPQPCSNFHQFRRFPEEIRCLIWEKALSYERWIRIDLHLPRDWETLPDPRPPGEYEFSIYKQWKISKLFRTTRESRRVALGFYRVQLPCWHRWDRRRGTPKKTTLYICPELDTLEFNDLRRFEYFANDVWSHDRLGVGIVNIATSSYHTALERIWKLDGRDKDLLKEALSRIERFAVMERRPLVATTGRDGIRSPSYHACPVYGSTLGFERLPFDSRLGDEHLKRISTGPQDPRPDFHEWFRTVRALGVQHHHKVNYQFGICAEEGTGSQKKGPYTKDRDAAAKWFRQNEQGFQAKWQEKFGSEGMEYPPIKQQGLEHAPQQAIGFWLFSLESIAPLPDIDTEFKRYRPCCTNYKQHFDSSRVLDMTMHKPELCLSYMH